MLDKFVDSCGFSWKRTCDAYALLSSACHCEAQSDGAIRSPCGSTKREAVLQANTKSVTDFPWESVVAHADSYMFLHVIARSEATGQSASPCVCHCEERSDGTIRIPCGSAKRTAVLWANAGKCNEFALSTTDLPGISAGTRIATPVCALVRNDMQKEGRVRGGKNVARNDMQKIAALLRVQEGACRGKSATAHEFALSATFSWLFLRGRGLPRRFAPRNDRLKTDTRLRLQGRTWDSSPRKGEPFAGPPCTGSQ